MNLRPMTLLTAQLEMGTMRNRYVKFLYSLWRTASVQAYQSSMYAMTLRFVSYSNDNKKGLEPILIPNQRQFTPHPPLKALPQ